MAPYIFIAVSVVAHFATSDATSGNPHLAPSKWIATFTQKVHTYLRLLNFRRAEGGTKLGIQNRFKVFSIGTTEIVDQNISWKINGRCSFHAYR